MPSRPSWRPKKRTWKLARNVPRRKSPAEDRVNLPRPQKRLHVPAARATNQRHDRSAGNSSLPDQDKSTCKPCAALARLGRPKSRKVCSFLWTRPQGPEEITTRHARISQIRRRRAYRKVAACRRARFYHMAPFLRSLRGGGLEREAWLGKRAHAKACVPDRQGSASSTEYMPVMELRIATQSSYEGSHDAHRDSNPLDLNADAPVMDERSRQTNLPRTDLSLPLLRQSDRRVGLRAQSHAGP